MCGGGSGGGDGGGGGKRACSLSRGVSDGKCLFEGGTTAGLSWRCDVVRSEARDYVGQTLKSESAPFVAAIFIRLLGSAALISCTKESLPRGKERQQQLQRAQTQARVLSETLRGRRSLRQDVEA